MIEAGINEPIKEMDGIAHTDFMNLAFDFAVTSPAVVYPSQL